MSNLTFVSAKRWGTILVCLLSIFPAFTYAKLGGLQLSDVVLLFLLCQCVWRALAHRLIIRVLSGMAYFVRSYCVLLAVLVVTAGVAMTQTFYPLYDVSIFFKPGLRSLSKLAQLSSVLCGFLWLANTLGKDRNLFYKALSLYWWTGVVGAFYTVVWYVFGRFTGVYPDELLVPVYGDSIRARGFFNEGGPYGVYLVSVLAIGLLRKQATGKRPGWSVVILGPAFLFSASKAGFLMAGCLLAYWVMSASSWRKKMIALSAAAVIGVSVTSYLQVGKLLLDYIDSYERLGANARVFGRDPNVVIGRIAASYIVPRMLAAHPLIGVGFGNYPITRNDPDYLGALPAMMDVEDIPGAGIPGIAAEVGIPITLWVVVLLCVPFMRTRKFGTVIGIVALVQPLSHVFGLQLTFFYPWFTAACALATGEFMPAFQPKTGGATRGSQNKDARRVSSVSKPEMSDARFP